MFSNCCSLIELNLSKFETKNVVDMEYIYGEIYDGCSSLTF